MQLQLLEQTAQRHRWTVSEYLRLGTAGIFTEDDRIELIDGELIEMAPIGEAHAGYVNRLSNRLIYTLFEKTVVAVQNPITLGEHSDPQPDITLLRWREDAYIGKRPTADDVLLLIEIADSTLRYDRDVKVPLYAKFAIPEVWLLNLPEKQLEVFRQPRENRYLDVQQHRSGTLSALLVPEAEINIDALF